MKKLYILSMMLCFTIMMAQTPQKMSYQAVIRNASNVLVANTNVGMRISILQTSVSGAVVYSETHTVSTNLNGLAALEIGGGAVQSGSFSAINWAAGPYFVKTETDSTGGTNYTITATSQLLSVPYALLAQKAVQPTYSVSASDSSTASLSQIIRNTWVSDPDISVIVPETGKYLLCFYGNSFNNNQYFDYETIYDIDGAVRVYDNTAATEVFLEFSTRMTIDLYTASNIKRKYLPMAPKRTMVVDLVQGHELKIQYIQYGVGATMPTGNWTISNGGLSILKIGD